MVNDRVQKLNLRWVMSGQSLKQLSISTNIDPERLWRYLSGAQATLKLGRDTHDPAAAIDAYMLVPDLLLDGLIGPDGHPMALTALTCARDRERFSAEATDESEHVLWRYRAAVCLYRHWNATRTQSNDARGTAVAARRWLREAEHLTETAEFVAAAPPDALSCVNAGLRLNQAGYDMLQLIAEGDGVQSQKWRQLSEECATLADAFAHASNWKPYAHSTYTLGAFHAAIESSIAAVDLCAARQHFKNLKRHLCAVPAWALLNAILALADSARRAPLYSLLAQDADLPQSMREDSPEPT